MGCSTVARRGLLIGAALLVVPNLVLAADEGKSLAQEDRIAELERKVEVLTDELERTRADIAVPESKLESVFGLGPAASKIYGLSRGLSIGGYAEGFYSGLVADKHDSGEQNRIDMLRAVLYTGYKFTDRIVWNSEIEFEHATTEAESFQEGGSVSVEFAQLEFLMNDALNARIGLMLVPMGFLNLQHEPPFYFGTHRPEVERRIIPTTWRENGVGIFGQLLGERLSYSLATVDSFYAQGFSPSGLRDGRQNGSEALAEDMAFVGRLDYAVVGGVELGGSLFVGNTGQDQTVDGVRIPDALTTLWDLHAQLRTHGMQLRALFTMAHVDQAGALSRALGPTADGGIGELDAGEAVAQRMIGGYAEISYEVLQWIRPEEGMALEPFFRFEWLDTQADMPSGFDADEADELQIYTLGLQFEPIPNVVLKLDYRNKHQDQGEAGDEVNVGFGLVF
jgi:hypothetical protein